MKKLYCLLSIAGCLLVINDPVHGQPGRRGAIGDRVEPEDLEFRVGVATIPDRVTFEKLSYKGFDVGRDPYLANLEYVKFDIENVGTDDVRIYFMNTENYRAHPPYMRMVGIVDRGAVRGALTYLPMLRTPDGGSGLYVYDFEPRDSYSFEQIRIIRDSLHRNMPLLKGKSAFYPLSGNLARYESEKKKYAASDIAVHLDEDFYANIVYLPMNVAEAFGRLRVMENDARPSPRDIVVCKTLPNQMPRVAGVIAEERQTPLSHVDLRAIQDKAPNAYISNALEQKSIRSLLGKLVHYKVTPQGYSLREASKAEVDEHFKNLRPLNPQTPVRDLSITKIRPLTAIKFENSASFGVKTANLAAMDVFKFPAGLVPDGFGVPLYFYDEFMKHNGLYKSVDQLLEDPQFREADRASQEKQLKTLRAQIKQGKMPDWMIAALSKVQQSFPERTSIRCRSSTNNEDLPGFSGAGLYDSFTHRPDEGHLSKSIKQVFASLWNVRAFEEREFHRIDHKQTAMGVLVHPNTKGEKANGVAVTDDILYDTDGNYYLNTQVGEDLVTNPDEDSSPEEILLGWWDEDGHEIVRRSTQVADGGQLLSDPHLSELRKHLAQIHGRFRKLYGRSEDAPFAMEIEFKITKKGQLLIKQARPWVF